MELTQEEKIDFGGIFLKVLNHKLYTERIPIEKITADDLFSDCINIFQIKQEIKSELKSLKGKWNEQQQQK